MLIEVECVEQPVVVPHSPASGNYRATLQLVVSVCVFIWPVLGELDVFSSLVDSFLWLHVLAFPKGTLFTALLGLSPVCSLL